jgi:hypothetical protein
VSAIVENIADRAADFLASRDGEGATVREIAEAVGANVRTLGNALRGGDAGATFERCGRRDDLPGRPALWRLRDRDHDALERFMAAALDVARQEEWEATAARAVEALEEARAEREAAEVSR